MNGLSSGTLAKTAILAQPTPLSDRKARSRRMCPILAMAFIFIPAWVDARFKNPQIRCVFDSASGMASIRFSSAAVVPFWTIAPNPPRKSMLAFRVAASRALANRTTVAFVRGSGSSSSEAGVMAIRRLVMGMPYLCTIRSAQRFKSCPFSTMRSRTRCIIAVRSRSMQSFRLMPSVTVRISK